MSNIHRGNDTRRPHSGYRLTVDTLEDRNAPGSLSSLTDLLSSIRAVTRPSGAIRLVKSPTNSAAKLQANLATLFTGNAGSRQVKMSSSSLTDLSGIQTTNDIAIPMFGSETTTIGTLAPLSEPDTQAAMNLAALNVAVNAPP
ncbi:MAG TPA: hypothetical protein PKD72_01830, partial [Gemmatales bacterium]|nr:hypothetical protein [Gemmatales bacterium]